MRGSTQLNYLSWAPPHWGEGGVIIIKDDDDLSHREKDLPPAREGIQYPFHPPDAGYSLRQAGFKITMEARLYAPRWCLASYSLRQGR